MLFTWFMRSCYLFMLIMGCHMGYIINLGMKMLVDGGGIMVCMARDILLLRLSKLGNAQLTVREINPLLSRAKKISFVCLHSFYCKKIKIDLFTFFYF